MPEKGATLSSSRRAKDLLRRFDAAYERSQTDAMRAVERCVCGCNYGGNSWTTQSDADELAAILKLTPASSLLDLGSGSGWPGLYLCRRSGCRVTLVDPSVAGVRIAAERAIEDGIDDRVTTSVGDAADLDAMTNAFDAISHSDLLCCLPHKAAVLVACRRAITNVGRMVFTVISIPQGLSENERQRSMESGPEFIECGRGYAAMLSLTKWRVIECRDLTDEYAAACRRQIEADRINSKELISLLGSNGFDERQSVWKKNLQAIDDGLRQRELYIAEPLAA